MHNGTCNTVKVESLKLKQLYGISFRYFLYDVRFTEE